MPDPRCLGEFPAVHIQRDEIVADGLVLPFAAISRWTARNFSSSTMPGHTASTRRRSSLRAFRLISFFPL